MSLSIPLSISISIFLSITLIPLSLLFYSLFISLIGRLIYPYIICLLFVGAFHWLLADCSMRFAVFLAFYKLLSIDQIPGLFDFQLH